MASFLIYIDGHDQSSGREVLAACGLSSLLHANEPDPIPVPIAGKGGPTGQSGVVLLPYMHGDERDPAVMYRPERQTWQRVNELTTFYVGWETNNPPTPYDLARPQQHQGRLVRLAGQQWVVPWCFATQRRWKYDANGDLCAVEEALCDALFQVAAPAFKKLEAYFDDRISKRESDYNPASARNDAGKILGFNYRLTYEIATALGLFTTSDAVGVIARATDLAKISELQRRLDESEAA